MFISFKSIDIRGGGAKVTINMMSFREGPTLSWLSGGLKYNLWELMGGYNGYNEI